MAVARSQVQSSVHYCQKFDKRLLATDLAFPVVGRELNRTLRCCDNEESRGHDFIGQRPAPVENPSCVRARSRYFSTVDLGRSSIAISVFSVLLAHQSLLAFPPPHSPLHAYS